MNLPTIYANFLQRAHYTGRNKELSAQNVILTSQVKTLISQIQATTDITTNTDSDSTRSYVGTPSKYSTYSAQVIELGKLYGNTADWGCMIAKNVIDVRTAFSVGEGIKVKKREGYAGSAEKELAWVAEFMRFNNLDEEMPQEYAKEAEIEGKVLLRFLVDGVAKNIRVVHVPWRQFEYAITTPDYDFFNYTRAQYTGSGVAGMSFDLSAPLFVYKRFGGNASQVNLTPPKTAFVLREIEDLDKALWDWRKINRIFAAPTPVITCPDKQTAKETNEWVDVNWRIGKMLVIGGLGMTYELKGWQGDGYTTLQSETQALVKTISGTTGVPVHFLGYPELLSNRDTAENLIKLISLSTSKERKTWIGAYEELFQKAMLIYNTVFDTNFNPLAVDVTIEETELLEQPANEAVSNRNNTSPQPG